MKAPLLPFAFFLALICSCNSPAPQTPKLPAIDGVVTATQFKEMLPQQYTLVDVRTPEEYGEGHIANALNFDFYSDNFIQNFDNLDKEKPLLIYCRSGGRSGKSYKMLKDKGFQKVYDLEEGYSAWSEQ